jgi:hypothetical protein
MKGLAMIKTIKLELGLGDYKNHPALDVSALPSSLKLDGFYAAVVALACLKQLKEAQGTQAEKSLIEGSR